MSEGQKSPLSNFPIHWQSAAMEYCRNNPRKAHDLLRSWAKMMIGDLNNLLREDRESLPQHVYMSLPPMTGVGFACRMKTAGTVTNNMEDGALSFRGEDPEREAVRRRRIAEITAMDDAQYPEHRAAREVETSEFAVRVAARIARMEAA